MFCKSCGAEVRDDAVVCVKCGCATQPIVVSEGQRLGEPTQKPWGPVEMVIWAILSAVIPIVGLALGIVGVCSSSPTKRSQGGVLIAIGVIFFVFWLVVMSGGNM